MRTKSLFHFTKKIDTLFKILQEGFWPRICFEDISWCSNQDFFGTAMVCFCDIPISRLENHTEFYGNFGIGMKREWAINNSLNPILYISPKSIVSETLSELFKNPGEPDGKVNAMITLAHTKPVAGNMLIGDQSFEKDFYNECEWRFIDIHHGGVFKDKIKNNIELENENNKTANNKLKFQQDDIRYLLVEKESDVIKLIDFINSNLTFNNQDDLKRLITKIIVLSELRKDI